VTSRRGPQDFSSIKGSQYKFWRFKTKEEYQEGPRPSAKNTGDKEEVRCRGKKAAAIQYLSSPKKKNQREPRPQSKAKLSDSILGLLLFGSRSAECKPYGQQIKRRERSGEQKGGGDHSLAGYDSLIRADLISRNHFKGRTSTLLRPPHEG